MTVIEPPEQRKHVTALELYTDQNIKIWALFFKSAVSSWENHLKMGDVPKSHV